MDKFFEKLRLGPSVLFLGQAYMKLMTGRMPFVESLYDNFSSSGDSAQKASNYEGIFTISKHQESENLLRWMQKRAERISIPDEIAEIAKVQWNNVYTSSIDEVVQRGLRSEWREVHPIYDQNIHPSDMRSKSRLHLTYLYGSVSQQEKNNRVPLDFGIS